MLDGVPATVVLAWPEQTRSRALAAFVHTATTVAQRLTCSPADGAGHVPLTRPLA
ncbi:hypothetical protein ACFLIM_01990 [Nonomuraea sp. M3C6]|uniref:LysR substrate binding domain-containing protein n=1 Tax=Nonomuraea marmarensis TaxID=3351344 RepID=A0ABW7A3P2_9ACTN